MKTAKKTTAKKTKKALTLRPDVRVNRHGLTIRDANKPLAFKVTKADVTKAKCGDPNKCVVAQAISRALPDGMWDHIEIGPRVSKIYAGNNVTLYSTPRHLGSKIRTFDTTGQWEIGPGDYSLLPLANEYRKAKSRFDKMKKSGGKQSKHKVSVRSSRTRYASHVSSAGCAI